MKLIKAKKLRKMTYQDLSWGVHPKMSGMQAQIELPNGFIVNVVYLDNDQLKSPGFECSHTHKDPVVQQYINLEDNPEYVPQKGMSIEGVDEYIQSVQKLPRPIVMKTQIKPSSL